MHPCMSSLHDSGFPRPPQSPISSAMRVQAVMIDFDHGPTIPVSGQPGRHRYEDMYLVAAFRQMW